MHKPHPLGSFGCQTGVEDIMKTSLTLAATLLLAGLVGLPTVVRAQWQNPAYGNRFNCESSDGRYRECRVDTRRGVQMTRQLSRTQCIEGQNWGIGRDVVWVDRGCRAEFATGGYGRDYGYGQDGSRDWRRYGNSGYGYGGTVVCESARDRHNRCPIDTRYGVVLVRQLSDTRCREGHNWGVDGNVVWVDHGCRAEFAPGTHARRGYVYGSSGYGYPQSGYGNGYGYPQPGYGEGQVLSCASNDGRQSYCRAQIYRGVELLRQESRSACIQGQSWGWDRGGVWVAGGCRAQFRVF